ncbi:hypothetical protein OUZ56_026467 [Daphnia magna]|uniref:Uncharacterized protein n=1 Tax=Daphnia magna TaxID=35525 RepID=A0ABQ9ZMU3_9CRUS|nr:hypothetical protein OUZ56_026467 [Daphnia magna]
MSLSRAPASQLQLLRAVGRPKSFASALRFPYPRWRGDPPRMTRLSLGCFGQRPVGVHIGSGGDPGSRTLRNAADEGNQRVLNAQPRQRQEASEAAVLGEQQLQSLSVGSQHKIFTF